MRSYKGTFEREDEGSQIRVRMTSKTIAVDELVRRKLKEMMKEEKADSPEEAIAGLIEK